MIDENHKNFKWLVLLTVIVGTFLGRLDQTIVNLALPKIITDFKITISAAGWIATAYILANAVFVPIWGKLGDTIGRKKVYILGFSIFIFGSALAGFAWNLSSMIVFRIIQAIAGSADYPTAMAILAVTFEKGKERAQALGLWSASFAAAIVFGPLIGVPMIDMFGWRSIFLLNIPVGIVGLIMAFIFIRESVSEHKTIYFDWWGAITLGVALSALVLVLDQGNAWGWFAYQSSICYIATILFTVIFVSIERRAREPIVDLKFFKNSIFVNTLANNFVVFMAMTGAVFLIPVFTATYLGYSATETGFLFIPMAICMMIASPIGGSLTGKVQPRYVIFASTLVAGIGIYLFSFLDPRSSALAVIIPLSIMAFGMGFGMAQRTSVITAVVPAEEMGIASSILALGRNIAGAFGIAVFGTILTNATNSNVLNTAYHSIIKITDPIVYQKAVTLIILKAQVDAYKPVFIWASILLFFGAFLSLLIKISKEKMNESHKGEEVFMEV
ncbi:MAG: DHA2 family efflux MFS transporter permease subunit [Candidatus Staskawiczbacteria bacterium]|nr:DHA2 family efflux MFS transporter permease subunit [Candidatus Staskawiczbacteria bacterium]